MQLFIADETDFLYAKYLADTLSMFQVQHKKNNVFSRISQAVCALIEIAINIIVKQKSSKISTTIN